MISLKCDQVKMHIVAVTCTIECKKRVVNDRVNGNSFDNHYCN